MKILKEYISELHNVTWPTKKQAFHSMITVIVIMLVVGVILAVLDNGLSQAFQRILENAPSVSDVANTPVQ